MDIAQGIFSTANSLGINPIDLATAISYETAGTFDPLSIGPTTKYGQHRGFIQFGEPQAKQYGVSFETRPQAISTQLGPGAGIYQYLKKVGVKPGMGLEQIYSAINTGGVNNLNMTDSAAGGMPGTVAEKVAGMEPHRQKALKFMESVMQNQPLNASPLLGPQNTNMPPVPQQSGMDKNPLFSMLGKTVGGGFNKLKDAVTGKDPDASDRLSIALMSLSGNPGQLQPLMAMAAQDIKDRKTKRMNNKSLDYIRQIDPELAKLVENDPRLMQQVLSQAMSKQLKGKKTIMNSDQIFKQFGQTLPEGSYEVTVGRDNKPTDINPINPKQLNPVDNLRQEIALRQSFDFSKNYGPMAMKIARLNLLEDLLDATPTGFMAGLADTAFQYFNLDNRSDTAAAAAAIINQLVPEQRQPGSGPMSDADLALFQSSVPSIAAKPGGNKLIVKTMQALAKYEQDFARIHGEYANGTITTIAERDRQIWALEDPMQGVRAYMIEQGLIGGPLPDDDVELSEEQNQIILDETEENGG